MENLQRKRNVAYRLRIGDILKGRPMMDEGKFLYLELGDKKVSRVNVIANCVDKFVQEGEKKYATITIDDASGQIRLKSFGEDIENIKRIIQGDTIVVIGNVRSWGDEIYIIPEIIKKVDPRWLLARKMEIQKSKKEYPQESIPKVRDAIIEKIKNAEEIGGIDVEEIIMEMQASAEVINNEIKRLMEEGIIYEPRPGKLRYLG